MRSAPRYVRSAGTAETPQAAEQWRPVIGYEGLYEVSSLGRVRSLVNGAKNLSPDRYGYLTVSLFAGGTERRVKVHRLVCEAFNGPCPDGKECAHLDSNKRNNTAANLAWATRLENMAHRFGDGPRMPRRRPGSGQRRGPKLDEALAGQILSAAKAGESQRSIARRFGISQTHVCHIVQGKKWRAVGDAQ